MINMVEQVDDGKQHMLQAVGDLSFLYQRMEKMGEMGEMEEKHSSDDKSKKLAIDKEVDNIHDTSSMEKTLPSYTWSEIKQQNDSSPSSTTSGACLIVYDGLVYDISSFVDHHPGGANILKWYIGKDCTKVFDGGEVTANHENDDKGNDGDGGENRRSSFHHVHSSSARSMLKNNYLVGKLASSNSSSRSGRRGDKAVDGDSTKRRTMENMSRSSHATTSTLRQDDLLRSRFAERQRKMYGVDIEQPLVHQVLHRMTTEVYLRWINDPFPGSATLFHSQWMEQSSRTEWTTVPTFWLPFIISMVYLSLSAPGSMGAVPLVISFLLGEVFWTFFEYGLHRFIFHWTPRRLILFPSTALQFEPISEKYLRLSHFLLHGIHHVTPMDGTRLVAPLVFSLSIALLFITVPFIVPLCLAVYSIDPRLFHRMLPLLFGTVAGIASGYVRYDLLHYFFHHGESRLRIVRLLKSKHMAHHYDHESHERYFGVSNPVLDYLFDTS